MAYSSLLTRVIPSILSSVKTVNAKLPEGCRSEAFAIYSPSMCRTVAVTVVLPTAYFSGSQAYFPVLYALHGMGAPYDTFSHMSPLRQVMQKHPMILVCFDGDADGFYLDSTLKPESQFTTFFFDELIPHIDNTYRTDQRRGLTGFSMGGYGSFHYLLERPGLFTGASSLSGALAPLESRVKNNRNRSGKPPALVQLLGALPDNIKSYHKNDLAPRLAKHVKNRLKLPPLHLRCGTGDFLLNENRDFVDLLQKHNTAIAGRCEQELSRETGKKAHGKKLTALFEKRYIDFEYIESPGYHNWDYWLAQSGAVGLFHATCFEEAPVRLRKPCKQNSTHSDLLPGVQRPASLPDPLRLQNGEVVATEKNWHSSRAVELRRLFQTCVYGFSPPAPKKIRSRLLFEDANAFAGAATLQEIEIRYSSSNVPPIRLLLSIPKVMDKGAPVLIGPNFCGNHTIVDSAGIALPDGFVPDFCPGQKDNRPTDAGRGKRAGRIPLAYAARRGYAVATFYHGDIDPDCNDFTDGVHPFYFKKGQKRRQEDDWGTIHAWAWGLSRCVDYLLQEPRIEGKRIASFGHSRNGKAALLAAAFDQRIALAIPHQSGTGGAAPSRSTAGESVEAINAAFPHWFGLRFREYNTNTETLPVDQHCLIALCAPRPVLLTNALDDTWANPRGQFSMLKAATPVYRLLGVGGLGTDKFPALNTLIPSRLGYYIRRGKHSMGKADWRVFLDYADIWLK